jgi:hypothetical protein
MFKKVLPKSLGSTFFAEKSGFAPKITTFTINTVRKLLTQK